MTVSAGSRVPGRSWAEQLLGWSMAAAVSDAAAVTAAADVSAACLADRLRTSEERVWGGGLIRPKPSLLNTSLMLELGAAAAAAAAATAALPVQGVTSTSTANEMLPSLIDRCLRLPPPPLPLPPSPCPLSPTLCILALFLAAEEAARMELRLRVEVMWAEGGEEGEEVESREERDKVFRSAAVI